MIFKMQIIFSYPFSNKLRYGNSSLFIKIGVIFLAVMLCLVHIKFHSHEKLFDSFIPKSVIILDFYIHVYERHLGNKIKDAIIKIQKAKVTVKPI